MNEGRKTAGALGRGLLVLGLSPALIIVITLILVALQVNVIFTRPDTGF